MEGAPGGRWAREDLGQRLREGAGRGGVLEPRPQGEGLWRFSFPPEHAALVAAKGSIALDGISLTVVEAERAEFSVAIIPETVTRTSLKDLRPGRPVNLEADILGKYVVEFLARIRPRRPAATSGAP